MFILFWFVATLSSFSLSIQNAVMVSAQRLQFSQRYNLVGTFSNQSVNSAKGVQAAAICSIVESASVSSVFSTWNCSNSTVDGDICYWDHVFCNMSDMSVLRISLSSCGLTGVLPSSLGLLSSLTSLRLAQNTFSGSIPTLIHLLSNLQDLRMNSNYITGAIPTELGLLMKLATLYLSKNAIYGDIPSSIGFLTDLTCLHVSSNYLSGPIPTSLGSLNSLVSIRLARNYLTGFIPSSIGLLSALTHLGLSSNYFSGSIPLSVGSLENIEVLRLSNNLLSGSIPSALWTNENLREVYLDSNQLQYAGFESLEAVNTTNLQVLYASNNQLQSSIPVTISRLFSLVCLSIGHNSITGTVPPSIGTLNSLTGLFLSYNFVTGIIPTNIGFLPQLRNLQIWHTLLTGSIPTELRELSLLVALNLRSNQLTGPIPTALGYLSQLIDLRLRNNQLTGHLPIQFSSLSQLTYLELSTNKLTGPIPSQLCFLTHLEGLRLWRNSLTGSIPTEIGHLLQIQYIYLLENLLTGPIPTEIGYLTLLRSLRLTNNGLSSIIPTELAYLSQLTSLVLNQNALTGSIPTLIGRLSRLIYLNLGVNMLTGNIPTEIGHLSQLTNLDLDTNILKGPIPTEIFYLSNIKVFNLLINRISGTIPTELGCLHQLTYLDLNQNALTGSIPTEFGHFSQLVFLNLGVNMLTGNIPTEIGLLSQLVYLNIIENVITGTIPTELGYLNNLQYTLDLSVNKLTGSIPTELGYLSSLPYLNLLKNKIAGSIPTELGALSTLTALELFDLSYNFLTGPVPSELCRLTSIILMYLQNNLLTKSFPSCVGNIRNLVFFRINNNMFTGLLPSSFCTHRLEYFYMKNSSITAFPTCLRANNIDFLGSIPHEAGSLDLGMCRLADLVQQSNALSNLVIEKTPLTYESEHPRIRSSPGCSDAAIILISIENAMEYQIVFDVLSQTVCPVRICADSTCKEVIAEYSGEKGLFPGTGRIPPIAIPRRYFYLSIGSMFCSDTNLEWGYRVTVKVSTQGIGWECSEEPGTLTRRNIRGLSRSSLPYAADPCSWTGVVCEGVVNVTAVSLKAFGVTGTIPSSLLYLNFLTSLDLSYNQFRGTLPSAVGYLSRLKSLDLTNNRLTGTLPSTLSLLTELSTLILAQNLFSGSIPNYIANMTYLTKLDLKSNQFIGKVSTNICPILQSLKNTSVILLNNPKLTCYESCWSRNAFLVFDGDTAICAPTSVPTSQPSTPTLIPTTPTVALAMESSDKLNTETVVGVTIAAFLVLMVFISIFSLMLWLHRKRVEEGRATAQLLALEFLPLHRAAYNRTELTEDMIRAHLHTAFLPDYDQKTLINVIFELGDDCRITPENLYIIVEDSLFAYIESSNLGEVQSNEEWTQLVQRDDDRSLEVVRLILTKFKPHIQLLAQGKDNQGRSCIDLASFRSKEMITRISYLHNLYELSPSYEYRSPSSQLWLATYHHNPIDGDREPQSSPGLNKKVALKFMKYKNQFRCELSTRRDGGFDDQYVAGIMNSYDGDLDDLDNVEFRSDAISKGFEEYPYCIVMEGVDNNLANMILNNNIAGRDLDQIKIIMKQVLTALQHMHGKGVAHGDIKPTNIVVFSRNFKLVNLDVAANIHRGDNMDANYSSQYLPPEMFSLTNDGTVNIRAFDRNRASFLREAQDALPYSPVKAAASYDMWSAGVLFYYLVTGSSLVLTDARDNIVEQQDMMLIYNWEDVVKYRKILHVTDLLQENDVKYSHLESCYMKNFLSMLLYRDPLKRLSASAALEHPFLNGKRSNRLSFGRKEFDIFLSYRADKNTDVVDSLYNSLIGLGLKVLRNQSCISPDKPREQRILEGLMKSSCVVCLLSRGSVDVTELNSNSLSMDATESHSMMLEWLLALELNVRELVHSVYPVMIGDNDGCGNFSKYFESGCHPSSEASLPTILTIYHRFRQQLEENSLGFPYRNQRQSTVDAVMKDITVNQGFVFCGKHDFALRELASKILEMTDPSNNRPLSFREPRSPIAVRGVSTRSFRVLK